MKLVLIGLAAALVGGSAVAQAPDAAQRAENRAKASELVDKATPGPAERAKNRAKAAELAKKVTPDAAQRAKNRAKAAELVHKVTPANSASSDDLGDSARRERMDEAYRNWQRQHGSR